MKTTTKNNKKRRIRGNRCLWSWPTPTATTVGASTRHTCDERKLKREKLLRFVSSVFFFSFYHCESMARRESIGFSIFKFLLFMRDASMCVHHVVMFVWFVSCLLNFYVPVLCGFSLNFSSPLSCILHQWSTNIKIVRCIRSTHRLHLFIIRSTTRRCISKHVSCDPGDLCLQFGMVNFYGSFVFTPLLSTTEFQIK